MDEQIEHEKFTQKLNAPGNQKEVNMQQLGPLEIRIQR